MRVQRILGKDLWLVFGMSLLLATSASAQVDTGSIVGTVKDAGGGVLPARRSPSHMKASPSRSLA